MAIAMACSRACSMAFSVARVNAHCPEELRPSQSAQFFPLSTISGQAFMSMVPARARRTGTSKTPIPWVSFP